MMPLYGSRPHKDFKIELVHHESADKIVLSFFRHDHPRMGRKRLLAMETDFHVFLGKRWAKPARVHELISHVKAVGVWGYCNHRSRRVKEIHYWVGPYASRTSVMEFVLHEVAHAGGFRTEHMACKVAGLGAMAYEVFESDFAGLLKEGGSGYNHQHGSGKDTGRVRRDRRLEAWLRGCRRVYGHRDQVRRSY